MKRIVFWGILILGLVLLKINGAFAMTMLDCPDTPNCVSSQASDSDRFIEPISFSGNVAMAMQKILSIIKERQVAEQIDIVTAQGDYLHCQFVSGFWGFVDDVEFKFVAADKTIQIRSASQSGYWDFGKNRERMEDIRAAFGTP